MTNEPRRLMQLYILDDSNRPMRCHDPRLWRAWFHHFPSRQIARDKIGDVADVATVFLGIDHRWDEKAPPLLFESIIFPTKRGPRDCELARYASWDDAIAGHEALVKRLRLEHERQRETIKDLGDKARERAKKKKAKKTTGAARQRPHASGAPARRP